MTPALTAASRLPVLPKSEQTELCRLAQAGGAAARERLVRHSIRLVLFRLGKMRIGRACNDFEEAFSDALLGLNRSIDLFSPTGGAAFASYAQIWITASVMEGRRQRGASVAPSREGPRLPDVPLESIAAGLPAEPPPDAYEGVVARQLFLAAWRHLRAIDRDLLRRRYLQEPAETLEQLGRAWGVSREGVRLRERATLKRFAGLLGAPRRPPREILSDVKSFFIQPQNRRAA